jgi:hypothetical protein
MQGFEGGVVSSHTVQENVQAYRHAEDPRWKLLERILRTEDFLRAPRLAEFLRYVCQASLDGRSAELHEQHVGEVVFGRSPEYDSSADTVVRSNALRLRRRLEGYFLQEGCNEPLRLEIPRGGYVPRFYYVERETPLVSQVLVETENPDILSLPDVQAPLLPLGKAFRGRWLYNKWSGFFLAIFSLAALAAGIKIAYPLIKHDRAVPSGSSELKQTEMERRFWASLFPPTGKTIVVPGDSGLVLYETVTGQEVTLAEYLRGAYRDPNRMTTVSSTVSPAVTVSLASRRYASIVDFDISSQLSHLPQWSSERSAMIFARDLRPSDAEDANLILLGSREANPWVSLVEPSMNFILTADKKQNFYFLNRHPRNGELVEYAAHEASGGIGAPVVYGDVAYLPNPGGKGMVLILGGLWMSGTQSAGDFVLDGTRFSNWLKSITNSDGTIPPFEVLIATKSLESSATYSSIIAKRIYAK